MNFQKLKKKAKWKRITEELEADLEETHRYNPEVEADVRWSIISLLRAIQGI